ncbi:MAG: MBL fold metallo-hydrolase [Geodermatophilaceae bacterium]|nr:MBL fold metallo-hydrolase [Geodermatophilaceae bacterium]
MRVQLCGVRGSTPAPGSDFVRYGGNTSCVAIAQAGAEPSLLLDAGTGLSRVSRLLQGRPFRGAILLSHLHWDHTHGLPFFRSGDQDGSRVRLLLPAQEGGSAEELLAQAMSPPHFPITPSQLRGAWSFDGLEEGACEVEGFQVLAREIPHKGGRTFGYRVSSGKHTVAYLSDHHPFGLGPGPDGFGPYHEAALALATDVDVLIHDSQYTAAEFPERHNWGHSAIDYAVGLAEAAGASRLVAFHHDPRRTDDELDEIGRSLKSAPVPATIACEGECVPLDQGDPLPV